MQYEEKDVLDTLVEEHKLTPEEKQQLFNVLIKYWDGIIAKEKIDTKELTKSLSTSQVAVFSGYLREIASTSRR